MSHEGSAQQPEDTTQSWLTGYIMGPYESSTLAPCACGHSVTHVHKSYNADMQSLTMPPCQYSPCLKYHNLDDQKLFDVWLRNGASLRS